MEGELELSLELSIGGCFAKSENKNLQTENEALGADIGISRSEFSGEENRNGECEFLDPQRKKEMQALRRREARMKRDIKRSRGLNGGAGAEDRETPVDSPAKREKICGESSSNLSFFGENKVCGIQQQPFMLPAGSGFAWGSNYFAAGEVDRKSSGDETENVVAAAAFSSAVSPHRSTCKSHKGGSSSDSGSHSSSFGTHKDKVQNLDLESNTIKTTTLESTTTDNSRSTIHKPPSPDRYHAQHNACLTTYEPAPPGRYHVQHDTCSTTNKPHPSPTSNINMTHNPHMPCVSTTGNGPNARTITGFLYKYTKSEVSIMCVCHGSFFSPAQFVEHAGGVDITNPLRHITIVPSIVK